jgi:hypothetical protein
VDDRLRSAVDANVGWHEDICALHGIESELVDGLWQSRQPAPRLHPNAVVIEPTVRAEAIVGRLEDRGRCAVKDSFATLDLSHYRFRVLFSAMWLHHRPAARSRTPARQPAHRCRCRRSPRQRRSRYLQRIRHPRRAVAWADLCDLFQVMFPNRSLVGYEFGDRLGAAISAGFTPVGPLRVWQR